MPDTLHITAVWAEKAQALVVSEATVKGLGGVYGRDPETLEAVLKAVLPADSRIEIHYPDRKTTVIKPDVFG